MRLMAANLSQPGTSRTELALQSLGAKQQGGQIAQKVSQYLAAPRPTHASRTQVGAKQGLDAGAIGDSRVTDVAPQGEKPCPRLKKA